MPLQLDESAATYRESLAHLPHQKTVEPLNVEELRNAIRIHKSCKAACSDEIMPEILKHVTPRAHLNLPTIMDEG